MNFVEGARRDSNQAHSTACDNMCEAAENKYVQSRPSHHKVSYTENQSCFRGHSLLQTLVVHPTYQERGRGSSLARRSTSLADIDQVPQEVIATDLEAELYMWLGYDKICVMHADGDEEDPGGSSNAVGRYYPKAAQRGEWRKRSN